MSSRRYSIIILLVVVPFLSGCRTYGGYGAKDATISMISRTTEAFSRSYERAQSDLALFQRAAGVKPDLEPFAVRYGNVVREHGELVDAHRRHAETLGGGLFAYSEANRLLGAMVSEENRIRRRYQEIVAETAETVGITVADAPRPPSNYEHVPPYYERLRYQIAQPSLEAVLRAAG